LEENCEIWLPRKKPLIRYCINYRSTETESKSIFRQGFLTTTGITIVSITDHLKQKVDIFLDKCLDYNSGHDKMNYICTYLGVEDNTESSLHVLDV